MSDSQKIDYLWKKLGYGVAKTAGTTGAGAKDAYNESVSSPLLIRGDRVWSQSGEIPSNPPLISDGVVQVYRDGDDSAYSATVECVEDLTSPDNQTWKTNLANWIPTQFGDSYLVRVYVDTAGSTTPQTTGVQLFQAGSGVGDTWFFDYEAGVLNFNGTIPAVIASGITGKSVYISAYRYTGTFGIGGSSVAAATPSTVRPASAAPGMLWFDTNQDLLNVYVDSVTGWQPVAAKNVRYTFTNSLRWLVTHNRNTTRFSVVLTDSDGDLFYAKVNTINSNSFEVFLTAETSGFVDVTFM